MLATNNSHWNGWRLSSTGFMHVPVDPIVTCASQPLGRCRHLKARLRRWTSELTTLFRTTSPAPSAFAMPISSQGAPHFSASRTSALEVRFFWHVGVATARTFKPALLSEQHGTKLICMDAIRTSDSRVSRVGHVRLYFLAIENPRLTAFRFRFFEALSRGPNSGCGWDLFLTRSAMYPTKSPTRIDHSNRDW